MSARIMLALREAQTVKPMVPVIKLLADRNPAATLGVYLDPTAEDLWAAELLRDSNVPFHEIESRKRAIEPVQPAVPGLKLTDPREIELESRFRDFVGWTDRLKGSVAHILDEFQPDVLVNAGPAGNLVFGLVLGCHQRAIPAIYLQHGLLEMHYHPLVSILSDKVLLWGDRFREFLLEKGEPREKLVVTGNPMHDRLVTGDRKRARENLGLANSGNIVLLISSSYNEDQEVASFPLDSLKTKNRWLREAVKTVMSIPGTNLIIKNHPSETKDELAFQSELTKPFNHRITTTLDADLVDLITTCDLVIMVQSSVIIKAVVAGRPVINYYSENSEKCRHWIKLNQDRYRSRIAVGSPSLKQSVEHYIQQGPDLKKHYSRELIRELAFRADGRSTLRVCIEIEKTFKAAGTNSTQAEEN